jgi:hypothetical protein
LQRAERVYLELGKRGTRRANVVTFSRRDE